MGHKKKHQSKRRATIEGADENTSAPSKNVEYPELVAEKNKLDELLVSAKKQKSSYRSIKINTEAKALQQKIEIAAKNLDEKLQLIDAQIKLIDAKIKTDKDPRIFEDQKIFLGNRNQIVGEALAHFKDLYAQLAQIEDDIFPEWINEEEYKIKLTDAYRIYAALQESIAEVRLEKEKLTDISIKKRISEGLEEVDKLLVESDKIVQNIQNAAKKVSEKKPVNKEIYSTVANALRNLVEKESQIRRHSKSMSAILAVAPKADYIEGRRILTEEQQVELFLNQKYQSVGINSRAKALWDEIQNLAQPFNEKLKLIDEKIVKALKLNDSSALENLEWLEQLLSERARFVNEQFPAIQKLLDRLEIMESDLFPPQIDESQYKSKIEAALELFNEIHQIESPLQSAADELVHSPLKTQINKAIEELNTAIAQEIDPIVEAIKSSETVDEERYRAIVNDVYILQDKLKEITARSETITKMIELAKVRDKAANIQAKQTWLKDIAQNIYMAVNKHAGTNPLAIKLRDLVIKDNKPFKVVVSADSIGFNEMAMSIKDLTEQYESFKAIIQAEEKNTDNTYTDLLEAVIAHQTQLRQSRTTLFAFYDARADIYAALRGSTGQMKNYEQVAEAIRFNFKDCDLNDEAQRNTFDSHLKTLLRYEFDPKSTHQSKFHLLLSDMEKGIREQEEQFQQKFPKLTNNPPTFNYNSRSYTYPKQVNYNEDLPKLGSDGQHVVYKGKPFPIELKEDRLTFSCDGVDFSIVSLIEQATVNYVKGRSRIASALANNYESLKSSAAVQPTDYAKELADLKANRSLIENSLKELENLKKNQEEQQSKEESQTAEANKEKIDAFDKHAANKALLEKQKKLLDTQSRKVEGLKKTVDEILEHITGAQQEYKSGPVANRLKGLRSPFDNAKDALEGLIADMANTKRQIEADEGRARWHQLQSPQNESKISEKLGEFSQRRNGLINELVSGITNFVKTEEETSSSLTKPEVSWFSAFIDKWIIQPLLKLIRGDTPVQTNFQSKEAISLQTLRQKLKEANLKEQVDNDLEDLNEGNTP